MTAAVDISIIKAANSKLNDLNLENMPFGKFFTDHMLEACLLYTSDAADEEL
jgi:branched-chain amino acid aminotransferase